MPDGNINENVVFRFEYQNLVLVQQFDDALNKLEHFLKNGKLNNRLRKRILSVSIEMLENSLMQIGMLKHLKLCNPGFFCLSIEQNKLTIKTRNILLAESKQLLIDRIELINELEALQLIEEYRRKLSKGGLTNNRAGLGLFKIIRRSGSKICYAFNPKDADINYLDLSITFQPDLISDEFGQKFAYKD